jgi:hypothetical protein
MPAIENAEAAIAEVGAAEISQLSADASVIENQLARLGSVTSETVGRVFWSGPGTSEAASTWAQANGGNTLDLSRIGAVSEDLSRQQLGQVVDVASKIFAEGASGDIHVFQGPQVDLLSTWARIEYPTLMNNPNVTNIFYHQVQIPIPGQ